MKALAMVLIAALALGGCTTTNIDASIQKGAPAACSAATTFHDTWVAGQFGSVKDQQVVEAAWSGIEQVCSHPSTVTAAELLIVIASTSVIVRSLKKVKADG